MRWYIMSVLRSQPARDSNDSVWLYQARGHQARQLFPLELQCAPFTWIAILIKFWEYFLSYNCIHAFVNGCWKLFVCFVHLFWRSNWILLFQIMSLTCTYSLPIYDVWPLISHALKVSKLSGPWLRPQSPVPPVTAHVHDINITSC